MRRTLAIIAICALGVGTFVIWPNFQPEQQARDRALPMLSKGDEPLVVVAFGTSLTARGRWPKVLGERLTKCLQQPTEIRSVAMPGAGSMWAVNSVPKVVGHKPDLVMIEFSMNDADLFDGVSLSTSRQQHDAIMRDLSAAVPEARLLLMTMNPVTGLQRLKRPRLQAYYDIYHDLADIYDVGLADMTPRWSALPSGWTDDGIHPHADLAEQILPETLAEMIAAAVGVDCP